MPRMVRLFAPGQAHHVLQRGNNRQPIFFTDDDRRRFLGWLETALEAEGCTLHAYVLMTNHFHLLLTPARAESIPRSIQSLGRRYVGWVNHAQGRTGTLWEGRYKSTIVDSETYLLACQSYIEANPVRAGMAASPADYPWSSYGHNALGLGDRLLSEHPVYSALGATPKERQATYRALFDEGLDGAIMEILRDSVQRGWVPGDPQFQQKMATLLGRPVGPPRRGRPPKSAADMLSERQDEKLL
jgi:putative transposase